MPTNEDDPAFTGPTKDGFASGCTKLEYFTALNAAAFIASADVDPELIATQSLIIAKQTIVELNKPDINVSKSGFGTIKGDVGKAEKGN